LKSGLIHPGLTLTSLLLDKKLVSFCVMWAMAIYSLDARPGIDAGHTLHCSPQQHLGAEVSTPKQWKQLPFWWPKSKDSYAKYDDL